MSSGVKGAYLLQRRRIVKINPSGASNGEGCAIGRPGGAGAGDLPRFDGCGGCRTHCEHGGGNQWPGNADPTPASYTWTILPVSACGSPASIFAVADSWIDQNSANNNFGADAILKVRSQAPGDNFRALVRFALPDAPHGCVVQSATLRLYAASWTNGRTLQALRLSGHWSERSVTWNNQPTTVGPAARSTSGSGWREWNVTTAVRVMINTGAGYGFQIRDANENGSSFEQQFHGREKGENVPILIVSFAPAGG